MTMSIFAENIVFLRGKKNKTQQELADELIMTRSRYISYEYGKSEPPIEILIRISKYYSISIDLLVTVDIRKYPLEEMVNLPGNKILVPVTVDAEGNNYIEIVPQKASMGYLKGFDDIDFIKSLQKMQLPFLKNGKFRAFMAEGDSMPPFVDQSILIGEYIERLDDLKTDSGYIIVTKEGITYKTFLEKTSTHIKVLADNSFYKPYDILLEDIFEIWHYRMGILPKDYKPYMEDLSNLKEIIGNLKANIQQLEQRMPGNNSSSY